MLLQFREFSAHAVHRPNMLSRQVLIDSSRPDLVELLHVLLVLGSSQAELVLRSGTLLEDADIIHLLLAQFQFLLH